MKKWLPLFVVFALIVGGILSTKAYGEFLNDPKDKNQKSIEVFIINPSVDLANKSSLLFEKLKTKYSVKIIKEKIFLHCLHQKLICASLRLATRTFLKINLKKKV